MLNLQPELLLDNIDGDKTLRDTFEMFGFSPNKFTDEKKRDTIRDQRAQIQQLSQTIEGLKQAGEAGQAINAATAEGG
jgi:hypothetical protein